MSHSDSQAINTLAEEATAKQNSAKRKKLFGIFAGVIAVAAIGYGSYWHFVASRYVDTDNAYTGAEISQVTPAVNGIVSAVNVVDTQYVKQGDVLVEIDSRDAKLALAQAEADLSRAERRVQGYFANDNGLAAQVLAREAEQKRSAAQLLSAQADLQRAELDLHRREALEKTGSVSGEEVTNARTALLTAQANLKAAEAGVIQADANRHATLGAQKASTVLTADTTVDTNPEVTLACAKRDQARLDLERTVLRAPVDGVVAKRQVQVGQRVQAGAALLSVVPIHSLHVDANFKEGQLTKVALGQPVTMTSDLYGSAVEYHGTVVGLSGGTGSAFAMIPAQNATGNWIKVVQRLPVRISINPDELLKHPLSVCLSMDVTIGTRNQPASNKDQPVATATATATTAAKL